MNDTTEKVIRKNLALAKSQHQNYVYSSKSGLKRLCAQDPAGAAKKILELEQRVKVLTDAAQQLMAWQVKNVHVWHNAAYDYMQEIIDQTPQQTAAQIERWHIEWMMKLPSAGYFQCVNGRYEQTVNPETDKEYIAEMRIDTSGLQKLFAIPPLPKESDSPETDLDEALRRQ